MRNHHERMLMSALRTKGKINLTEAMELLDVSESTARRLFSRMAEEEKVIRVHGGVQLPVQSLLDYSFEQVLKNQVEAKRAIGKRGCETLEKGDVLFCDAGTTVLCFCMELAHRMEERPIDLKVYTNSLASFEVLSAVMPVTLIGGEYRPKRKDFHGYLSELVLSKLHFTKCFLGTDGCDMKRYFTTTDFSTARLSEMAIEKSDETIVLCSSEKFSTCTQVGHIELSKATRVITDDRLSRETRIQLEKHGIILDVVNLGKIGSEAVEKSSLVG